MKLQKLIRENHLALLFQQGNFGLEKESQRVDRNGNIVTTPHPAVFGNRSTTLIFKPILPKVS